MEGSLQDLDEVRLPAARLSDHHDHSTLALVGAARMVPQSLSGLVSSHQGQVEIGSAHG